MEVRNQIESPPKKDKLLAKIEDIALTHLFASLRLRVDKATQAHFGRLLTLCKSQPLPISNFIQFIYDEVSHQIKEAALTKDQLAHFLLEMQDFVLIQVELEKLAAIFATDQKWVADMTYLPNLNIAFDESQIKKHLHQFISHHYAYINTRTETDSRFVRRLDSLARIFDLHHEYSVCNAVALHRDELIISFNVSHNQRQKNIYRFTQARVRLLESYLDEVRDAAKPITYARREQLYKQLTSTCPSKLPPNIFVQAIDKLTHAVLFDASTFSPAQKTIFLNRPINYRVLMPFLQETAPAIEIALQPKPGLYILDIKESYETHQLHLLDAQCCSVSHVHAEQLLAKRIFIDDDHARDYAGENKLIIGVTKLACGVCAANLDLIPVITRGRHPNVDRNTVSFFTQPAADELKALSLRSDGPTAPSKSPRVSGEFRYSDFFSGPEQEIEEEETTSSKTIHQRTVTKDISVDETATEVIKTTHKSIAERKGEEVREVTIETKIIQTTRHKVISRVDQDKHQPNLRTAGAWSPTQFAPKQTTPETNPAHISDEDEFFTAPEYSSDEETLETSSPRELLSNRACTIQ